MRGSLRQTLALVLLTLWIALSAITLWWFQYRHISQFNDYWASFNGSDLRQIQLKPETGNALVVHFIDANCPCSRFAKPHINTLESNFSGTIDFKRFEDISMKYSKVSVPASPAVAIWDKQGDLAYVGPYSGGNICGQGDDFTAMTLRALEQGSNPEWINNEAVGCFCQWPTTS
ncbi:MAG: DUF6436 domain-containing protein [Cellvibrionaceae bacterium]